MQGIENSQTLNLLFSHSSPRKHKKDRAFLGCKYSLLRLFVKKKMQPAQKRKLGDEEQKKLHAKRQRMVDEIVAESRTTGQKQTPSASAVMGTKSLLETFLLRELAELFPVTLSPLTGMKFLFFQSPMNGCWYTPLMENSFAHLNFIVKQGSCWQLTPGASLSYPIQPTLTYSLRKTVGRLELLDMKISCFAGTLASQRMSSL